MPNDLDHRSLPQLKEYLHKFYPKITFTETDKGIIAKFKIGSEELEYAKKKPITISKFLNGLNMAISRKVVR